MKKIFLTILLISLSYILSYGQTNSTVPSGAGTEADPYQISSLANLSWLTQNGNNVYNYYKQNADIDASETATWDDSDDDGDGDRFNDANDLTTDGDNDGWLPLGSIVDGTISPESKFSGYYDGNNHSISGLTIVNRASFFPIGYGFIRIADSLEVKNLGLVDINFNGNSHAGGLAGEAYGITVRNCYVTGKISQEGAGEVIGGLIGRAYKGLLIVEDSYTDVEMTVDTATSYASGFICYIDKADSGSYITRSHSNGNINGCKYTVGGFLAKHQAPECEVSECYSTGDITAGRRIGAFIGFNKKTTIKNCYSLGDITVLSDEKIRENGAFVGYSYKKTTVENCYSTGSVFYAKDTVITEHGFIGRLNKGHIINCFFDSTKSNQMTNDSLVFGKSTTVMMTDTTFINAGWDFTSVWQINGNYPNLINHSNPDLESPVSVENKKEVLPIDYTLEQNYPNPFNPSTVISYRIPNSEFVTLKIYNLLGKEITTLVNKAQPSGAYKINFNASNLTSGIYFYKITAGSFSEVHKMMLLK